MPARLQRRRRKRCNIRPETRVRSRGHLRWVRGFICLIAGKRAHICFGKPEAHHVRRGTDGALGIKPSDCYAVPLCSAAHRELHDHGEERFGQMHDVNLLGEANKLWRQSEHGIRYRMEQS